MISCASVKAWFSLILLIQVIMLTDFDYGRIQQQYSQCKNISETARVCGFSRNAVAKAVEAKFKRRAFRARRIDPKIRKRRAVLGAIVKETCQKGHRKWPKYSSSRMIGAALHDRTGEFVSYRQVQRDLHALNLKPYVRPSHPTRSTVDLRKRSAFAKKHRRIDWKKVVFSDESWLCCNERTGRIHWCKTREEVIALEKKARWNVASIMVWSAIGHDFKAELIIFPSKVTQEGELRQFRLNAESYVRRCLMGVTPRLKKEGRIFQQDGARSHTAKSTTEYLTRKGVNFLEDWPPYSPDLNAIERIWKELNARVGARCPMNQEELTACALEEWKKLPQQLINSHCAHFPKQLSRL